MESGSNRSSSPLGFEHMTGLVWPAHSLSRDVLDALIPAPTTTVTSISPSGPSAEWACRVSA